MATDYTKDIDFINKRLREQANEFDCIYTRLCDKTISRERYAELFASVGSVYKYFNELRRDYNANK